MRRPSASWRAGAAATRSAFAARTSPSSMTPLPASASTGGRRRARSSHDGDGRPSTRRGLRDPVNEAHVRGRPGRPRRLSAPRSASHAGTARGLGEEGAARASRSATHGHRHLVCQPRIGEVFAVGIETCAPVRNPPRQVVTDAPILSTNSFSLPTGRARLSPLELDGRVAPLAQARRRRSLRGTSPHGRTRSTPTRRKTSHERI